MQNFKCEKVLIIGLGNKGLCYENTRHNIGFKVLDYLAKQYFVNFSQTYFGDILYLFYKEKLFILLKPDTFMNLSGKAVKYWMNKEKLSIDQLLVITDDIYLTWGALRLRPKGGYGGHNGLKSIQDILSTSNYPRLRIGIGGYFKKGHQTNYVLGKWTQKELSIITQLVEKAAEAAIYFGINGMRATMNIFNINSSYHEKL